MNTQAGLHQLSSLVGDVFRLLGDLGKFNLQELRKLRNSVFVALAVATIPVTIATAAPLITGIIDIGWLIGLRAILGAEIGTILHARKIENVNLDAVIRGFDQFLVFSAGIITTEVVVCFMGSILPAENNLTMAMMLWPVAIVFVAYTFWSKGATWWKPICLFTLIVTLARLVVIVGWPEDAAWFSFVHPAYIPGTFIPSPVWLGQAPGGLTFLLLLGMLNGAPIFVG